MLNQINTSALIYYLDYLNSNLIQLYNLLIFNVQSVVYFIIDKIKPPKRFYLITIQFVSHSFFQE